LSTIALLFAAVEIAAPLIMSMTPLPEVTNPGKSRAAVIVIVPPVALLVAMTAAALVKRTSRPESTTMSAPLPVVVTLAPIKTPSPAVLLADVKWMSPPAVTEAFTLSAPPVAVRMIVPLVAVAWIAELTLMVLAFPEISAATIAACTLMTDVGALAVIVRASAAETSPCRVMSPVVAPAVSTMPLCPALV
jgi:hypothetical protein